MGTTTRRPLRAGVVGLGVMGRNHVRVLRQIDGVDLVGLADPVGHHDDVAGPTPLHTDVNALIRTGLDLCVVAVPTEYHKPVALALAAAGVHTLVEKPLADSLEDARAVADAFAQAGLVGAVGHIERFNPALVALRQRLEAGQLGEVFQISTRRQGPFPVRIKDVGVVMDLATHDVDLAAWVGGSRYGSISARAAYKTGRAHEDLVAATGMLADGTVTNHLVNWLSPTKDRKTVILGERGSFVANTLTADLTFHANGTEITQWDTISTVRGEWEGDVTRYAIPKPEPLRSELEAFIAAIGGGPSTIVTMAEGLEAIRVAEAVLESVASGRTVTVPSVVAGGERVPVFSLPTVADLRGRGSRAA